MLRKILPVLIVIIAAASNLHAQLSITTASLPGGVSTPATAYSQTLTATGGTTPYTWSVDSGTLPNGVVLAPLTGTLSGTPTVPGAFTFVMKVTDSATPTPATATKSFTVGIFTISPANLPSGTMGTPYSANMTATGGGGSPYSWALTAGPLPPGLAISGAGAITGTPTGSGVFNFTLQVSDNTMPTALTATRDFSITVAASALTITTASLPGGISTPPSPYSQTLAATGGITPYTWTVDSGTLPTGVTLAAGTGILSGTPTAPGVFTFVIKVTDSATPTPATATRSFTVGIFTMAPANLPGGSVGTPYTTTNMTATGGGGAPYSWALATGSLPPGLNLQSTGTIGGTPTTPGVYGFTLRVSDNTTPTPLSATRDFSITIQTLAITTTSLPGGVSSPATPYSQTLTATGGTQPFTWSLDSGALPNGLTLSNAGVLSGTPTTAAIFTFTIKVTDSTAATATRSFTIGVFSMTPATFADATAGTAHNTTVTATGGNPPYTWTVISGALPTGLTLSTTGTIVGTPTTAGYFDFTLRATDSTSPVSLSASRNATIGVRPTINTTTINNAAVGVPFSQTLTGSPANAPVTWSVVGGTMAPGLSLASDGILSGTPTTGGTFNFTINLVVGTTPPVLTASKAFSQVVQGALTITTNSPLPEGVQSAAYSRQLESSAPAGQATTWSVVIGATPPGLSLNASSGLISGTPSTAGTYDFTVRVTSGTPAQTADKAFRLVVNTALTITTLATLPDALLGAPYSVTFIATGGIKPYKWNLTTASLPPGLTLTDSPGGPSEAILSGTPSALGTTNFTLRVVDSNTPTPIEQTRQFTLVVTNTLSISTETIPHGFQNLAYSQTFTAVGGNSPFTWIVSAGTLPAGMSLLTGGVLQGTPTELGTFPITITLTDSRGKVVVKDYVLVIDPALPTLSTGIPGTVNPTQTSDVSVSLATPFPSELKGQLVLTFASRAEVPSDDPMTRFSNGTRTVAFTVPANTTAFTFTTPVQLTTGTVAGTITLQANFDSGPRNVAVGTVEISATPPQITNVTAVRTVGALEIQITGYASARRITNVEFTFDVKVGDSTQKQSVSRSVDPDFSAWYRSVASTPFGSTFSYIQGFTVQGDTNAIEGVTVRLSNAQGGTTSAVIPFR